MLRLCLTATVAVLAAVMLLSGPMPLATNPASSPARTWTDEAWASIVRTEYEFKAQPDGAWSAPNRAQGLRLTAQGSVAHVTPRTEGVPPWVLSLGLRSLGREGAMTALVPGTLRAE